MSSVKVAVRVRPFNNREVTRDSSCIIEIKWKYSSKFCKPVAILFYVKKVCFKCSKNDMSNIHSSIVDAYLGIWYFENLQILTSLE